MRTDDVVFGEFYESYMREGKPCVAVRVVRPRGYPQVELSDPDGQLVRVEARYLTPWQEFLTDQSLESAKCSDMAALVMRLTDGIGLAGAEKHYGSVYSLRLDEDAAAALFARLSRAPLDASCTPSLASDPDALTSARLKLSRRVRSALGAGKATAWDIDTLDGTGFHCQVHITFDELQGAVDFLDPTGADSSSLADIFS